MRKRLFLIGLCWLCWIEPAQAGLLDRAGEDAVAAPQPVNVPECPDISATDNTQLEMIGKIVQENRPYAALAFLDASRLTSPKAQLLRAGSLRQIGKLDEAGDLYRKLTDSCVSGYAHQGLGLIHNQRGQNQAAAESLAMAARLIPIDSTIRADYGYALALLGQHDAAMNEYRTAIELNTRNQRAINNMLLLLLQTGQQEKALQLAQSFGMTAADLEKLQPGLQLSRNGVPDAAADGPEVPAVGGLCEGTSSRPCTGILSPRLERLPNEQ